MFLGRVAGTVWSTVKWPQAQGLKLLLVRPYRLGDLPPGAAPVAGGTASEPTDDLVVCADTLDAGPGDDVIVAFGHAARVALSEKPPPAASRWSRSMPRSSGSSIAWRSRGEGR